MQKSNSVTAVQNLPSHSTMVQNIVSAWQRATPAEIEAGTHWYGNARDYAETMAAGTGYTVEQCAAVIAALSPKQDWQVNKRSALACLQAHARGEELPSVHYPVQVAKARRALVGGVPMTDILQGPKESAFFHNIVGSPDFVTVDRWAFKTATGTSILEKLGGIGKGAFRVIAAAYREAAHTLGVSLPTLQAVVWVVERGSAE
jgi:hypothetical protein